MRQLLNKWTLCAQTLLLSLLLCGFVSAQNAPDSANDADGDQVVDTVDVDDDNDGIPDHYEIDSRGYDLDSDEDGIPNRLDLDSDNDGLLDWQESGAVMEVDFSSIRVVAGRLLGLVGENGLLDALETPLDTGHLNYALIDSDGDFLPDFIDLDADNDGTPDLQEAAVSADLDSDGDARIDAPPGSVGNDGILDALQSTNDLSCCDVNGDGVDDVLPRNTDGTDLPDFQDLDSDNDSVSDLAERGGTDTNGDGRVDGFFDANPIDGMDDVLLRVPLTSTDLNGNGVEDQLDPAAHGHGADSGADPGGSEDEPDLEPDTEGDSDADGESNDPPGGGESDAPSDNGPDSDASGSGEDVPPNSSPSDDPLDDGVVQTGTNASGCSIGSATFDAFLPLLALLSIVLLAWRITIRRVR